MLHLYIYHSIKFIATASKPCLRFNACSIASYSRQAVPWPYVFIPGEYEKDWLNKNLSKEDVLALCQPFKSEAMKANTVSKLITTKEAETNVEDVLKLHNYEKVGTDEIITEL